MWPTPTRNRGAGVANGIRYRYIGDENLVPLENAGGNTGAQASSSANGAKTRSRPNAEYVLYAYGEPVAMSADGDTSYFGTDILGSVRSVTDKYGNVKAQYEYDAFGSPYLANIDSGMSFGYTGKIFDSATGLYDYGFRDYSPNIARFTTVDPVRDGSNWFSYVVNDPVNYIDPFGLTSNDICYTVKSGDTMWKIAGDFDCTTQQLIDNNNYSNPNLIHPGDKIYIPVATPATASDTGSTISAGSPAGGGAVSGGGSNGGGAGNASMGGGNSGSSFSSVGMGTGGHSSGSFANSSIEQKGIGMSAVVKIALGTVITTSSISNSVSGTTFGIGLIANGISDVSKPYYENGTNDYYVVRPEHPEKLKWDDTETIIIRPNTGNYQYVADGAKNARTGEVIKFSDWTKAKANQDANGNITYSGLLSNDLSIENFIGGMGGNVKNFLGKILGKYSGRSVPGVYQEENLPDDLKGWYDDPILQEAYRRAVHYQLEGE